MMELLIEEQQNGNIIIIHIHGDYNIHSRIAVDAAWKEQVKRNPGVIAFECSRLELLDSTAIGALVVFFKTARENNIKLLFCDLHKTIAEIFSKTGLNNFFTITSSEMINCA
ncbi:MAG: STAS domain-containing protein [bacterium]|nr:STAS domain-containing protein [bacterium]